MRSEALKLAVAAISILGTAAALRTDAKAQTINITPRVESQQNLPGAVVPNLRVQVTMQVTAPVPPSASTEEQRKIIETLRANLYESAAEECSRINNIFKGDCRLTTLNVNSSVQDRGVNGQIVNATGTAAYDLSRPR